MLGTLKCHQRHFKPPMLCSIHRTLFVRQAFEASVVFNYHRLFVPQEFQATNVFFNSPYIVRAKSIKC